MRPIFLNRRTSLLLFLLLAVMGSYPLAGNGQQLVPIIRQGPPPASKTSVWNAFVRVSDFGGVTYVSLTQAAVLFDGRLRWRPVSKQVDLTVRGRSVRFFYGSARVLLDGRAQRLERATVKNDNGFWVPASFFASKSFFRLARTRLQWPPEEVKASFSEPAKPALQERKDPPEAKPMAARLPVVARHESSVDAKAIRRVVIDPGHGGKDPGAIGARGTQEKALNLWVAQELAEELRTRHDYEVLLTRTDDSFIPLEERAQLANRHDADLFISIHCNASLSSKLKGFEVYFLSEKSSDPHADAVARLENAPLALEGKTPREIGRLENVLRSLVKNANINEASTLGALVDQAVGKELGQSTRGVKQAAFYVLRGAEMPAILLEVGFLSNRSEERQLLKTTYRRRLVRGMASAIARYDQRKRKERLAS